jgi:hypothetical protein
MRWGTGVGKKGMTGVVRFVERKAQKSRSLLRQGPLWANSPVVSPVRLDRGRKRIAQGRALIISRR